MGYKRSIESLMVPPSKCQLEYIRKEINEDDDDKLRHNERLLNDWIECQPHFPKNYEKIIVRNFLRNSKHILERAKKKLENHFIVKHLYPEYYCNRSARSIEIKKAIEATNVIILPKLTKTGRRIIVGNVHCSDASNFDVAQAFKLFFMIYDLALMDPNPVGGEVAIFDGTNFTAIHLVKFLSPVTKPLITILKEAYLIRLKEIHLVNTTPVQDKLFAVLRPLFHPKVRNSIIKHSSIQSLRDHFGEDVLPSDYGGECKSIREFMTDWQEILNDNEEWFHQQESVKITEKIPEKVKNLLYFTDQIGVEGSFRQLEID